jgi:hypothetical protein
MLAIPLQAFYSCGLFVAQYLSDALLPVACEKIPA